MAKKSSFMGENRISREKIEFQAFYLVKSSFPQNAQNSRMPVFIYQVSSILFTFNRGIILITYMLKT